MKLNHMESSMPKLFITIKKGRLLALLNNFLDFDIEKQFPYLCEVSNDLCCLNLSKYKVDFDDKFKTKCLGK